LVGANITLAGIACIIMHEVYATIGESIYPNPSFLSEGLPRGIWETTQEPQRVHFPRYG